MLLLINNQKKGLKGLEILLILRQFYDRLLNSVKIINKKLNFTVV